MEGEYVNEAGERIVPGSRRPDGSYRKAIRIKAGYIAQDEQPVYQSRGAVARQGVPKVPGMADEDVEAAKTACKSKSAKKNERRKQKKAEEGLPASGRKGEGLDSIAAQVQSIRLEDSNGALHQSPPDESGAVPPVEDSGASLEKRVRALKKKLKQAEALKSRGDAGESLTGPEREKIQKLPGWRSEIQELEEAKT